ncbi:MAG: type II secretion system protein [Patescibacteria group bacterium]|nr:type II secretion system GspH family protein [Patescibacteria group bacterium]MDE1941390.1 type II secretion system protein [Patescibacteria group bacterium]MDE1966614.1 type II secretion system protein [Patescibacteria group bacterium]
MKKYTKGFTLIELLVVIAIIGILASVVLVSLGSARNKGSDAKIQEQMAAIRNAAELFYSSNGSSYAGVATVTSSDTSGLYNLTKVASNWPNGQLPTVYSSQTGYVASEPLVSNTNLHACVDSSGAATTTGSGPTSGQLCNGTAY